jgi:hypothetical protein
LASGVATIYSTRFAFAALKSDGSVVAWGYSVYGGRIPNSVDFTVNGEYAVTTIYSTIGAFAALKSDGSVVTWGLSTYGGSIPNSVDFTVNGLPAVTTIYASNSAFAALKSDGSVVTWGGSSNGGDSSSVSASLTNVLNIYSNYYAFAALKSDGSVVTWGGSSYGGDSSSVSASLTNVAVISYGNNYYQGQYYTNSVPIATLPPTAPICFPAGTPVTTDQGNVAIEKLNSHIHTIRGKPIVAITQTRPLQKHIVSIEKDALAKNVPSQTTEISLNHKVFYKGQMVKARELVDVCENVQFIPYNGETLYNVLLEEHDKMMINNLICETLSPKNIMAMISKMSEGTEKNRILRELTCIINKNDVSGYKKLYASLK